MRLGQIGGALAIGGWAFFLVGVALVATGHAVGVGSSDLGGLVLAAATALLGSGAMIVAIAGPKPLDSRALRFGMATLAVGLLSSLASTIIAAASPYDPLASMPWIVTFLLGAAATALGTVIIVVALVLTRGPTRLLGALLAAGIAVLIVAWIVGRAATDAQPAGPAGGILAVLGCVAIVVGGVGVGALAIRGERSPTVQSA